MSECRACKVLDIYRSSHRYSAKTTDEEDVLLQRITELATQYGLYVYRRITAMLQNEGWNVNHKRIERLLRLEGLKVLQRQPKHRRLWLNDGSCIQLRPMYRNHVWSYDFVHARTHDGRSFRLLTIIDEYTRECLAIDIGRRLTRENVLDRLTSLFVCRGIPEHIRSDNGSEFTAKAVRSWLKRLGAKTLFIEPGSPWQNGHVESFHNRLRDECLNQEWFLSLTEARIIIESWRKKYNRIHPHSNLGMLSPNMFAKLWQQTKQAVLGSGQATPSLRQGLVTETSIQYT